MFRLIMLCLLVIMLSLEFGQFFLLLFVTLLQLCQPHPHLQLLPIHTIHGTFHWTHLEEQNQTTLPLVSCCVCSSSLG